MIYFHVMTEYISENVRLGNSLIPCCIYHSYQGWRWGVLNKLMKLTRRVKKHYDFLVIDLPKIYIRDL